jgi:tRNA(Ile)-lysidine synthase
LRGAGVKGLSSMKAVIFLENSLKLIRPLIECSREEIEEFLEGKSIKARIDSTNYDTTYLRNRIRHELLPLFKEKYNSNIKDILFNTIENLQLLANWIEKETEIKSKRCLKQEDGKLLIDYKKFKKFHPALQREIIRDAIKKVKGNLRKINYEHWKEIEKLFNRKSGSIVDLPQGISLKKEKNIIYLYQRRDKWMTKIK